MRFLLYCSILGATALVDARNLLAKRDDSCAAEPKGHGPVPSPDNSHEFLISKDLANIANQAETPKNYTRTFQNLQASTSTDNYLGFIAMESYDTNACALNCTAMEKCQSINIFFERDPSLKPGDDCVNPPSTNVIKCVFWGSPALEATATNKGYTNEAFAVVVAGSNGYHKSDAADPKTGYIPEPLPGQTFELCNSMGCFYLTKAFIIEYSSILMSRQFFKV